MRWKRWIALLLLSMLPLQGATAARMLFCGLDDTSSAGPSPESAARQHGGPARVDDGMHHEAPERHTVHADHVGHAARSGADGSATSGAASPGNRTDSAQESSADHRCQFCAICLHATTGAPVDRFEWRDAPAASTRPSIVSAGDGLFLTGAPERPPSPAG